MSFKIFLVVFLGFVGGFIGYVSVLLYENKSLHEKKQLLQEEILTLQASLELQNQAILQNALDEQNYKAEQKRKFQAIEQKYKALNKASAGQSGGLAQSLNPACSTTLQEIKHNVALFFEEGYYQK